MWKLGTGCLSLIHQMQRAKVIMRALRAGGEGQHLLLLLTLCPNPQTLLALSHLSSHDVTCPCSWHGVAGWVLKGHPGVLDLGFKMWVWRGSGCRFTPTVTKLVSPVGQSPPPVSHRQIPDNISPPHMFFTHLVHCPRAHLPSQQRHNLEPLPMQNLFFSFYWWNRKKNPPKTKTKTQNIFHLCPGKQNCGKKKKKKDKKQAEDGKISTYQSC